MTDTYITFEDVEEKMRLKYGIELRGYKGSDYSDAVYLDLWHLIVDTHDLHQRGVVTEVDLGSLLVARIDVPRALHALSSAIGDGHTESLGTDYGVMDAFNKQSEDIIAAGDPSWRVDIILKIMQEFPEHLNGLKLKLYIDW